MSIKSIKFAIHFMFIFVLSFSVYGESSRIEKDIELANMGNSGAALRVGSAYLNGTSGVEKDYEKARYWLEISASKKNVRAMYSLGYMYLYGEGVEKDYKMAYDYFDDAKNLGFAPAYYILGIMFYDGAGVKKNYKKAYEYCKTAFNMGYKTNNIILDDDNKTIIIK